MGTSIRQVMEDTILDDKWLLKKGSMIQMPTRVVHTDTSLWGPDADDFNPRRFMKNLGSHRAPVAAFRVFGGGTTLCPGRHFATNEVLAVVSMFIMRYDMAPQTQSGDWDLPTVAKTNVAAVIMEPDADVEVVVSRRKGFEQDRWTFRLEASQDVFAVVTEDRVDQH